MEVTMDTVMREYYDFKNENVIHLTANTSTIHSSGWTFSGGGSWSDKSGWAQAKKDADKITIQKPRFLGKSDLFWSIFFAITTIIESVLLIILTTPRT